MDTKDWNVAIQSTIKGGITSVIEVPRKILSHNTKNDLEQKNKKITKSLLDLHIPLNYFDYLSYSEANLLEIDQLGVVRKMIKGIFIHLESDKYEELDDHWENLFRSAAHEDIPITIRLCGVNSVSGPIKKGGESLLEKAIYYTEKWSNRLFVLNVSNKIELDLIQQARKRELLIFAETTPQHLFLNHPTEKNYLWEAINNDVIETIGSGYNIDQQGGERVLYNGINLSLNNPIFMLPLLLNAVHEKKISIEKLARLTSKNLQDILEIKQSQDFVLIDPEKEQKITVLKEGHPTEVKLKGWPVHTIVNGQIFS